MPKRTKRQPLLTPGRKRILVGIVVAIALWLAVDAIFGTAIRVGSAVRALEAGDEGAEVRIRNLGTACADEIESQLLAGGRGFATQAYLGEILLLRPFYMKEALRRALSSEDATVRRAAAMAMLSRGVDRSRPGEKIDDDVLKVLTEWTGEPTDKWLTRCFHELPPYRDPRLVDVLLPLVLRPSEGNDAIEKGLVEEARFRAIENLVPYAKEERVVDGMREILSRKGESDRIRRKAVRALAAGGYQDDPEIYWIAARSDNAHVRQAVADNLREIRDPKIMPILEFLLGDPNETVRRAAVGALMEKRSSILMKEADYLAEDWDSKIKMDLAQAVGLLRNKERRPFLVWCLEDYDPEVVRIAHWELARVSKGVHCGFTKEQWQDFKRSNTVRQSELIKEILNDDTRREEMVVGFSKVYPPRKTDRDRVPHLIRHLEHRDRRNVERAMKQLVRITGRREGFPEKLLDPAATPAEKGAASFAFMKSDRAALAASWQTWWESQPK
jgi:HEAT repeat protein